MSFADKLREVRCRLDAAVFERTYAHCVKHVRAARAALPDSEEVARDELATIAKWMDQERKIGTLEQQRDELAEKVRLWEESFYGRRVEQLETERDELAAAGTAMLGQSAPNAVVADLAGWAVACANMRAALKRVKEGK